MILLADNFGIDEEKQTANEYLTARDRSGYSSQDASLFHAGLEEKYHHVL